MPSNVQPPRGMRDFLPDDKALREGVMATIRDAYSTYGFREIETPVAEDLSRLESGQGGDNEKLIFKILKRGLDPAEPISPADAADLGLRYDLTVPLTRFYATHRGELPAVFRSIQMAPVWRAERPQKGRYRQFTQCDIDVLGEPSIIAEIELIVAMIAALGRLGVEGTTVRLNDRQVLAAILEDCGFEEGAHSRVLITIDKLDKIGVAGVTQELRANGDSPAVGRLVELLEVLVAGGLDDPSAFGDTLDALPPAATEAADRLVAIREAVVSVEPDASLIADPTLVRGMGYYTGPIFELSHPASSGSIGGGGRYDGMIGRLSGTDVPACGFSIGFERVIELVDRDRFRPARSQVALIYEDTMSPAQVVGAQRRLVDGGATVRLVRRPRNMGRLFAELTGEGFDGYVSLPNTGLEITPLGGTGPGAGSGREGTP